MPVSTAVPVAVNDTCSQRAFASRLILFFGHTESCAESREYERSSIREQCDLALWKCFQGVCLGNQFVCEGHCTVEIVARDEDDYVVKVVSCSGRPD